MEATNGNLKWELGEPCGLSEEQRRDLISNLDLAIKAPDLHSAYSVIVKQNGGKYFHYIGGHHISIKTASGVIPELAQIREVIPV